uniref:Uncharacterized protein n=1 Tax=Rhizophora mucronata TaxID=61149 RepID=A0A2P2N655_RHIMU
MVDCFEPSDPTFEEAFSFLLALESVLQFFLFPGVILLLIECFTLDDLQFALKGMPKHPGLFLIEFGSESNSVLSSELVWDTEMPAPQEKICS